MKSKAEDYGHSDQVGHNDDNQRDNTMDVSTASKAQNVDRPTTSSTSPTDREMASNDQALCGRSEECGDDQDSRRDDVSSARDAASDPNSDKRRRSM